MTSKKITARILAILLAFAMMVGTMPIDVQASSVTPFATDITNYINVTSWALLDADGVPFSVTNGIRFGTPSTFTFTWESDLPVGMTISEGDSFSFELPASFPNGSANFENFPFAPVYDSGGRQIATWRVQNRRVEVVFGANADGSTSVSGSLTTGHFNRVQSTVSFVRELTFANIPQQIQFYGVRLAPITPNPQWKTAATSSTNSILWVIDPHFDGVRSLSGQGGFPLGQPFEQVPGLFVEDTLSGRLNGVQFFGMLRHPVHLDSTLEHYGYVSSSPSLYVPIPASFRPRVIPLPNESRDEFRARLRLEPFQWGVWEDNNGVQTFMAYFGVLGQDGPMLELLNSNFIEDAANVSANGAFFDVTELDALRNWYTAVYGSNNAIGGRIADIRIYLTEGFDPVREDRQVRNYVDVTRGADTVRSGATGTLRGVGGTVTPVPGGSVRLWLVDQETSALLPNANFQLQSYESGSWVNVTAVGDNGIFTTGTDGSFTTPLGNGTFRFVQTSVSSAAYVLTNPLHNSYCPIEGVPVSPSFTLSGGAVGETVTVYNVRCVIPPPTLAIRKELRMPYGTTVPNATFEFDITLVSIFPTPPAITVVTIPNPTVTFNSTMTPVPHPDHPGYVYVHAYAPIDLSGITWTMPGVYRFRVTEMQNSGLASNPNYTIVYDPAVFYLYIYVGREFGDMTDPLEVLGYYVRHRVPTNACDDCEEDEYCATCDYALIKEPVLMTFKNRLSRRPATTSFEVIKEVTGRMGDTNLPFDFEVEMLLPGSAFPLSNTIEATITGYARGVDGHITLPAARVTVSSAIPISVDSASRVATHTFELRHGDVITFTNVPVGTTYVVTEDFVVGYDQSGVATEGGVAVSPPFTTSGDDDLVIEGTVSLPINETEVTNYVTVTNAHDGTPPMGVLLSNIPFGLMVALGAGALGLTATAVIVSSKVKKKR